MNYEITGQIQTFKVNVNGLDCFIHSTTYYIVQSIEEQTTLKFSKIYYFVYLDRKCPEGWSEPDSTQICYKVSPRNVNKTEAVAFCMVNKANMFKPDFNPFMVKFLISNR